jgi:tRNA 2-selenouridine synthase
MRIIPWDEARSSRYNAVIDVRSPSEFAEDHLPDALNLPVLDDEERAEIGTIYCQQCRFEARRRGAMLVARNIASHLGAFFAGRAESDRFLIYCWRGGQRSRSMATILDAVGWRADVLRGGYKGWRTWIRERLVSRSPQIRFHVLTGLTGSGKSRILRLLAQTGSQVLDLESLGCHRGSLLGDEPGQPQPSQKHFEGLLATALDQFDPHRPVWVESESKRLGRLWIPEPLWQSMQRGTVTELSVPLAARADFLADEYAHFQHDPEALAAKLETLREPCGGQTLAAWRDHLRHGAWRDLSAGLLERHYDPVYRRCRNYAAPQHCVALNDLSPAELSRATGLLRSMESAAARSVTRSDPAPLSRAHP